MIKAKTIIAQLQGILSAQTDLFTESDISVTSLSRSGTTVTAVTSVDHKLSTGRFIAVKDALSPIAITSIIRVGTTATVTTATDHDFTENFDMVTEISGADQSEYNGTFPIATVPNRRTFTFTVPGSPVTPATGTIFSLNNLSTGYNGRHTVTVVDPTTFTYEITETPDSPAQGTIVMRAGLRISGAVSMQTAVDAYTTQGDDELWGFVVLGDVFVSKDRKIATDLIATFAAGDDQYQMLACPFSIFVIVPTTDSLSGREARDQMEDVAVAFFKSLLGVKPDTVLTSGAQYTTVFSGHRFVAFFKAYYIHEFLFESSVQITPDDIVDPDFNVAFRDISLDFLNPNETDGDDIIMEAEINLDDTEIIPPPPALANRSMDFASSKFLDMSDANFGAFDRSKFAISLWYKLFTTGASRYMWTQGDTASNISFQLRFGATDKLEVFALDAPSSIDGQLTTEATFTDTTSWHHILYHFDAANGTPGDRMRLWHDGVEITVFDTDNNPTAAVQDSASTVVIGSDSAGAGNFFNGKLYQAAFFSGALPDISEVFNAGAAKDVTSLTGLYSLLNTDDVVALEDDFVLTTDWINNGGVAKSTDIP